MRLQRRFDLTQLDPVAADLDLVVGASEELQVPVRTPADHVAGAVHPLARGAERAGDEAFGREAGPAQVSACELVARHVQLTRDTCGDGPQGRVQDVDARVPHGAADGQRGRLGVVVGGDHVVGAADGHFGGTVVVDDRHGRVAAAPVADLGAADGLATDHELPRRGAALVESVQVREVARGGLQEGQLVRAQRRRQVFVHGLDDDPAAARQGAVQRGHTGVEGDGRVQQGGPVEVGVGLRAPAHVVDQVLVRDQDALGAPRRPRGVDDVRGVGRQLRSAALGRGQGGGAEAVQRCPDARLVDDDALQARHVRQGRCDGLAGEDEDGPRVFQHVGDAVGRVLRVHRHVGATGLENREECHHQVDGAFHGDGDQGLRPHTAGDQKAGQPVRARVQLGVRAIHALGGDGGLAGGVGGLLLEELGQRGRGDGPVRVVPVLEDLAALGLVEDLDASDAVLGGCRREPGQDGVEAVRVPLVGVRRVQLGAGVRGDLDPAVRGPVVDAERDVVEVAAAQRMGADLAVAEGEVVGVGDDVDDHAGEVPAAYEPEVPEHVLVAVLLVAQGAAHLDGDLPYELLDGHRGADRQPDRQQIGRHARGLALGAAEPAEDGEGDDDVLGSRGPVEVHRGGRDRHAGDAGAQGACRGAQVGGGLGGHLRRAADQVVRCAGGDPAAEADRGGKVGEDLAPVRAVLRLLLRAAVGAVGVEQVRERRERTLVVGVARPEGRVDLRDAVVDQRA
ncbi:hypothetical protein P376_5080 [Streptomyces sp. HCCB10043]|nr:hypothetical protein P376_5080 [Streptomyces sp. HCCB10043]